MLSKLFIRKCLEPADVVCLRDVGTIFFKDNMTTGKGPMQDIRKYILTVDPCLLTGCDFKKRSPPRTSPSYLFWVGSLRSVILSAWLTVFCVSQDQSEMLE